MYKALQNYELFDNQVEIRLVTVDDIAKMLSVAVKTVQGWVLRGEIPSVKINGARRFDLIEIEKWLSERTEDGHK